MYEENERKDGSQGKYRERKNCTRTCYSKISEPFSIPVKPAYVQKREQDQVEVSFHEQAYGSITEQVRLEPVAMLDHVRVASGQDC